MLMNTAIKHIKRAFLLCCVSVALVSCASWQRLAEIRTLADKVWEFSQTHPDGFTISISDFTEPTEGIAVSYDATQGCHSRESLPKVIEHARQHDGYVGGWLDTDSGLYYFDSSRLFTEDQRDAAIAFGKENRQIAIYVISTGESIEIIQ